MADPGNSIWRKEINLDFVRFLASRIAAYALILWLVQLGAVFLLVVLASAIHGYAEKIGDVVVAIYERGADLLMWITGWQLAKHDILGGMLLVVAVMGMYSVPLALIGALVVTRRRRNRTPCDSGHCATCGYDLRGLPDNRCPECGSRFAARPSEDERAPDAISEPRP